MSVNDSNKNELMRLTELIVQAGLTQEQIALMEQYIDVSVKIKLSEQQVNEGQLMTYYDQLKAEPIPFGCSSLMSILNVSSVTQPKAWSDFVDYLASRGYTELNQCRLELELEAFVKDRYSNGIDWDDTSWADNLKLDEL